VAEIYMDLMDLGRTRVDVTLKGWFRADVANTPESRVDAEVNASNSPELRRRLV